MILVLNRVCCLHDWMEAGGKISLDCGGFTSKTNGRCRPSLRALRARLPDQLIPPKAPHPLFCI